MRMALDINGLSTMFFVDFELADEGSRERKSITVLMAADHFEYSEIAGDCLHAL
jgi:hypothetical protein